MPVAHGLLHELRWRLRNHLTLSAPLYKHSICSPQSLITSFSREQQDRYSTLSSRYDLAHWNLACDRGEYLESLYILDLCDQHLHAVKPASRALDIGCKGWSYLPGLYSFAPEEWDGIELDPYRRYWNMVTYRCYGEYMTGHFPGCHYHTGSLLQLRETYNLITWFLPFVSRGAINAWGIPPRFFQPEALLQHAWKLLQPGAQLMIINQETREAKLQEKLFTRLHIPHKPLGEVQSLFSPYKKRRFGWLCNKPIG